MIKPKVRRQQLIDFICDADGRGIDDTYNDSFVRMWYFREDEGNLTVQEAINTYNFII